MALALALGMIGGLPAAAQEALYGRQPPHGSGWLRVMNATAQEIEVSSDFAPALRLGTDEAGRVRPYRVVEGVAGRRLRMRATSAAGAGALTFNVPPDGYTTVMLRQDAGGAIGLVPIQDQADFNQNRARLSFYNADPACPAASLSLEGGPAVFRDIAPGHAQSRTVNPVAATVRATCAAPARTDARPLQGMRAGTSFSLWLLPQGSGGSGLLLTPDEGAPYAP